MKLVLASLWAPVGVGAYLLRAAKRLGLDVVTVGPTMGENCWSTDFSFPDHAIYPDFKEPVSILRGIENGIVEKPDLWVDIDGGFYSEMRMPWPHALVATDPHIAKENGERWTYNLQRQGVDYLFCMQKPYCVDGGFRVGGRADIFLPYAYDPTIFYPGPGPRGLEAPMDADVTVLGMPYTKRTMVAKELARRGFRVLEGMGTIFESYARDLHRAPVCFIWSLKDDVPCRVFEAAACGLAIVVNDSIAHHIHEILPGLKFATFEEHEDLNQSVGAAANAVEALFCKVPGHSWGQRTSIVPLMQSARSVLTATPPWNGHTWDARLRTIVKTCLGKEI